MVCRFPATDFLNKSTLSVFDAPLVEPPACFDDHEATAFWFGMEDGPDSLRAGIFARIFSILFRFVPSRSLPNERLECIRRLTVCLNCGLIDEVIVEVKRAHRHGVTAALIISLIGSFHGPMMGSLT
jgi:hypothetical protein